ncbi:N-acyl homoserine lactonase family protein [Alicyclobacillus mengziensis]|uniref:N-acyl homoserine lactonase family protein n=1 Tax=Alicyclobacillus mengziensis TaxID=2931921 RepID=A0A9X7VVF0_9BACL|nr:N-acyl homoserine lactonase family protein [Alicyclobacillus mengziensis]QSO45846.1 N-acyl homoserine lactonase family protein [Alicyclobacillus mengziensis]
MTATQKRRPKLYVMDNGRMRMDSNWLVAMNHPATSREPEVVSRLVEVPVYTVLIDHPEGKILFDSACHPHAMGENGRWPKMTQETFEWLSDEACYLPHRLEALGLRPADIRYVVASHLHMDHAGCLEMFPNATIFVHEDEWNGALQSYARRETNGSYIWADVHAWIQAGLRWHAVNRNDDVISLADGVQILNFGSGHSLGMLGLSVDLLETGRIILASDAAYTEDSYVYSDKIPGAVYDTIGYRRTVERIHLLAAERNSEVWFGHDSSQFAGLRKSTEGAYE